MWRFWVPAYTMTSPTSATRSAPNSTRGRRGMFVVCSRSLSTWRLNARIYDCFDFVASIPRLRKRANNMERSWSRSRILSQQQWFGTATNRRSDGDDDRAAVDNNSNNDRPNNRASVQFYHSQTRVQTPPLQSAMIDLDRIELTRQVDALLHHTRQLMMHPHRDHSMRDHHIVAFSGGVDSSLVAALVYQAAQQHKAGPTATVHTSNPSSPPSLSSSLPVVTAVLGISAAVPQDQILLARRVARAIGIPLTEVTTQEGQDADYIANNGQACYVCKTHLYSALQAVVNHAKRSAYAVPTPDWSIPCSDRADIVELSSSSSPSIRQFLYNGTNADDLQDPTRVGLIAAQQFDVLSPIAHLTKAQVRFAARHLGLPNWNYASSPCLRSRLAVGAVQATQQHLHSMEQAELLVRHHLRGSINETTNLRVRLLARNRARVEIDMAFIDMVACLDWKQIFSQSDRIPLSFAAVEVQPFQSGSVSTTNRTRKIA